MSYTLVTGASSGIGLEFARQLAGKGRSLILVARNQEKLNKIAEDLSKTNKISVHVVVQDLGQLHSAEELFDKIKALNIEVNFLINNAGRGIIGRFDSHSMAEIQEMILLNVLTLTKLTHLFLPQLKKNAGILLNVASQAGFNAQPYMAAYGGTKAYVLNFTEALREELEKEGVKVMALCPGPTYTNFFERAHASPNDINFKFRTTEEVVSAALDALKDNQGVTIPGWENQAWVTLSKFLPRKLIAKLSANNVNKK